jgi:hypothetical protein
VTLEAICDACWPGGEALTIGWGARDCAVCGETAGQDFGHPRARIGINARRRNDVICVWPPPVRFKPSPVRGQAITHALLRAACQ